MTPSARRGGRTSARRGESNHKFSTVSLRQNKKSLSLTHKKPMLTRWEGEFWSMLKDTLRMSSASLKALDLKTSLICTNVGCALQEVLEEESLALTIPIVEKPGTSLWKVKYCAAEWEAQAQIKVRLIRSVSLTLRPLAYAYH
jgi:hypothetical protein